eukprot:14933875-Ditylum_brightwellii.AAC.1
MMMMIPSCCHGSGFNAPRKRDLKARLCLKMRRHFVAPPPLSPWYKLFISSDDVAMITTTGFDHEGFPWLLQLFKEVYDNTTALGKYDYIIHPKQRNKSRPKFLDVTDCLGLTLMWTCTRGPVWAYFISHPTKPNNNPPGYTNKG